MSAYIFRLQVLFLICLGLPVPFFAQGISATRSGIEAQGSIPPVPEWYECINEMRGKPFKREQVDGCLKSVLSHPHFNGGKAKIKRLPGRTLVTFVLNSPALVLTRVDFGLNPELEAEFEKQMNRDPRAPHIGDIFDGNVASDAKWKIEGFLKSQGIFGLASMDEVLDYKRLQARVTYKIWEGPETTSEEPLLPGGRDCEAYVGDINLTNVDDFTPLSLIESTLGLRRSICYSAPMIKKAQQSLLDTGIFSALGLSTADHGEWRNVTLMARTRPTKVQNVSFRTYGVLSGMSLANIPPIPLVEDAPYSLSDAQSSVRVITNKFTDSSVRVKVLEQNLLTPNHELTVIFHIVGSKADTLTIDGEQIR